MRRPALLVLLAACGSKAAATDPTTTLGNDDHTEHHVATPCPDASRVIDLAVRAFAHPGKTEAHCTALYAGEPLWLIDGYVELDSDESYGVLQGTAMVTPAGEVTWVSELDELPWGAFEGEMSEGYTPIDLDADGDDEVLEFGGYNRHGYEETWVSAYDVRDRRLVASEALIPLGSDNSAAAETEAEIEGCAATHAIIAGPHGGFAIEVTRSPVGAGACENPGRHVYAWDGKDLKEAP